MIEITRRSKTRLSVRLDCLSSLPFLSTFSFRQELGRMICHGLRDKRQLGGKDGNSFDVRNGELTRRCGGTPLTSRFGEIGTNSRAGIQSSRLFDLC